MNIRICALSALAIASFTLLAGGQVSAQDAQTVTPITQALDRTDAGSPGLVPLDIVMIPWTKTGKMPFNVEDQYLTSKWSNGFGVGGFGIGFQPGSWTRKDDDGPVAKILKSIGISGDVGFFKHPSSKFSKFLRTDTKTGTAKYTRSEWNNPESYHDCTDAYSCGSYDEDYVCCEYTYNVDVYGTPDGHLVAFQKQNAGVRVWLPVIQRDRFVATVGGTERFHQLGFANSTSAVDGETWRTSHNISVDGAVRVAGPFYTGGSYERSYAGYKNQGVKWFFRLDLGKMSGR